MEAQPPDAVPLEEAGARLVELADEVVGRDVEMLLTKDGGPFVALVDARKLDYYHGLEAEYAGLVLLQDAIEGLEDVAAGRVLDEAEFEKALARALSDPGPGRLD